MTVDIRPRMHRWYLRLNQTAVEFVRKRTTQETLAIVYMTQALILNTIIERDEIGVVYSVAELFSVPASVIPWIWLFFAWWCFQRDRYPIHYVIGLIPFMIYGIISIWVGVNGAFMTAVFMASINTLAMIGLGWIGVVQQYQMMNLRKDLNRRDQQYNDLIISINSLQPKGHDGKPD